MTLKKVSGIRKSCATFQLSQQTRDNAVVVTKLFNQGNRMTTVVKIVKSMTNNELVQIVKDWDDLELTQTTGETLLRSKVELLSGKGSPNFLLIAHGVTSCCMRELLHREQIV